MFIADAFAQSGGGQGSIFTSLAPIFIIFGIFYFLVIAPQRKKQKAHEARVSALGRGAKIITNGGLYATVQRVVDHRIEVVLDGGDTKAVLNRASVATVLEGEAKKSVTANDTDSGKKAPKTAKKASAKTPAKAKKADSAGKKKTSK